MTTTAAGAGRFVKVSAAMILSERDLGDVAPLLAIQPYRPGLPELEPGVKALRADI
jgi:hypothetical protein